MVIDKWQLARIAPRLRVILDNDYCGDPDGVVQLGHHLLCRSVDVRAVIGSAVAPHHPQWTPTCAEDSVALITHIAALAGRDDVTMLAGSSLPLASATEPRLTPGAQAIVDEAMREDTDVPLVVACAGGLTTIASAWLMEPRIADRLTIAWLGGHAYDLPAERLPADHRYRETNVMTDIVASQIVFNDAPIPLWQVPQGVFSDIVASRSELLVRMRRHGALGRFMFDQIGERVDAWSAGIKLGETYSFGDLSIVLITALTSAYDNETSSSRWIDRPRPRLLESGLYEDAPNGVPTRVYTKLDVRLLLEDLYAKLEAHALSLEG